MSGAPAWILASGSPRRRELLGDLGVEFTVVVPDVDESAHPGEDALAYVARVAAAKAAAVVERVGPEPVVLAADTTVEIDGFILAKPDDEADAIAMLTRLSGRTHRVHTGVVLRHGDRVAAAVVTTEVDFARLSPADIARYVESGEPMGKAGAYAIQGRAGSFVAAVRGNVQNVIGLPLTTVRDLAAELGVDL
jgi:septum formation protein